jgi:hypothetical protein
MDRNDFSARILPEGFFLYYRGYCIGAEKADLYEGRRAASEAVTKIMRGEGFAGFLAAVSSIEKRKGADRYYEKQKCKKSA